ncbi:MAG: regulatory protein DeoR [Ilumatobacteraceae bacterium]|nr:regulatory protein DeoR [Ilumatobacteraceae bacterium]
MRADRLVAILMLLQTRGQVTAAEVANELEVSERTARRDLDALGMAGLPIYSVQGRNGGWRMLGDGTTDLSALTSAESQALFLVAGPSSSAAPELKAALRKLVRALPETFRAEAIAASTAMVVDHQGWDRQGWGHASAAHRPPPEHLEAVQRAVVTARQLELGYVARDRTPSTRTVHPLGVAAKGASWYMVAATDAGLRTFRIDRITSLVTLDEPVVRPDGFDLQAAWRLISDEVDQIRSPVVAEVLVEAELVPAVRWMFGTRARLGPPAPDGRIAMELRSQSVPRLAMELAGFGGAVEVLSPPDARERMTVLAGQLAALYPAP